MSDTALKLLVVDDEEGIVDFTTRIYTRKGFITFGATDGIKAVEIFEKERPDISLIDVHMPYSPIDGIETLKRIKNIDKNAICIMVTRITEQDTVDVARGFGADAYVLKPLEMEDLDKVISDVIKKVQEAK
ncbi:MAG: response regulator [Candidatus Omnitrophica bacterium]|nr:response regulator [Candidatus Omnitrophota bacterium]